ncbi:hypothetical protein NUW58_g10048 [Xylaria curta]|uniref:Uncharacterized protein n=1 Tax=Xylaria curta TaxID=42375 RepID=A0ACC1MQU4_9PEZI|nr:hypothetical protein NUW58_g10048 [Xylaria curta]
MSRQAISGQRHILRALSQWPSATIRPEVQFQAVLRKRFEQPNTNLTEEEQLKQANALYSLLENRYKRTYPITGSLLQPKSNPTYFTDLLKDLEEAPNRTFFERLMLRLKGVQKSAPGAVYTGNNQMDEVDSRRGGKRKDEQGIPIYSALEGTMFQIARVEHVVY